MGTLHNDQYLFLIIPHPLLLRMTNVSDKSCREHQNTHFMLNNLFQKSCHLRDNGEKVCRTRQATDNNMAHAHCILDTLSEYEGGPKNNRNLNVACKLEVVARCAARCHESTQ